MKSIFKTMLLVVGLALSARAGSIFEDYGEGMDFRPFHATDSLAARDEWGPLHQMPHLNAPDVAPRYPWRPLYWVEGRRDIVLQPAYVGALQRDLQRLGYYCGPIDGVYTAELSDAIARMQKNYSMRVTGTPTVAVRRALHLP